MGIFPFDEKHFDVPKKYGLCKQILASLSFSLLLLNGCMVSKPDYPAHWAPVSNGLTVQDLSGFYHPRLAGLLNLFTPHRFDSSRYSFNFSVDMKPSVRAQFICEDSSCAYGDDRIIDLSLPSDRYRFKDKSGELLVIFKSIQKASNPLVGPQREYCRIARASDGALIVQKGAWARGLFFF